MVCTLSALARGERGAVCRLTATGAMRRRLMDIGLTPGTPVEVLFRACFGDPTAYLVRGTVVALRREDAERIYVRRNT